MSASASAVSAASAFSMKFAWRGEICAPPIRCPRNPHASSIRPADRSCSGFLNTLPNVRLFVGWASFLCPCIPATICLISSSGRGVNWNSTVATIWPGRRFERR